MLEYYSENPEYSAIDSLRTKHNKYVAKYCEGSERGREYVVSYEHTHKWVIYYFSFCMNRKCPKILILINNSSEYIKFLFTFEMRSIQLESG